MMEDTSSWNWPWPPTASTSTLSNFDLALDEWPSSWDRLALSAGPLPDTFSQPPPPAPAPSPTQSSASSAPSAEGRKKLSCLTCRNGKLKCVWVGDAERCVGCAKRGISCAGSAPRVNNRRLKRVEAVTEVIPNNNTALVPNHSTTYRINPHYSSSTRPAPFSPYQTATGRPRNLNPSSSEANINALTRATRLRSDLINLYRDMWPLQLMGLPVNAFEELLDHKGDEVTKVFIAVCTAIGARSSSHSEIVQEVGPSLASVDDDVEGQFTPGGFSVWGARRHGACFALSTKAIDSAWALIAAQPSFKTLKLALAAASLSATLHAERRVTRPFSVLAIQTWRKLLVSPETTEEEMGMLINSVGPVLLMRDLHTALATAEAGEMSPAEANLIVNANPADPDNFCFGMPDCVNHSGLVVFDENQLLLSYFKHHLLCLHVLGQLLATGPDAHVGPAEIARLREVSRWMDGLRARLQRKLAELEALPPAAVFVAAEWAGSWRPAAPKQHALILVSEVLGGFERIDEYVHIRLTHVHWPRPTLEQAVFRIDVCERCRAAVRGLARSCRYWLAAPRKHASFAGLMHDMASVPGWVELALGRVGEVDGPLGEEAEVTVEEVELIVRGLRLGSFSQGSLVIPLREMERGLEELRKEEREKERVRCVAAGEGKADSLDFDLDNFLLSLESGSVSVLQPSDLLT